MAWFKNVEEPAKPQIRPLSQERLVELFEDQEWHYNVDDDGDLGGRWDHTFFYFFRSGGQEEILNVSARFLIPIPEDKVEETRQFIEDWHREHLWPKAYTMADDEGQMRVAVDVALDYEHGVTDAQLLRHARCAIGTTMQLTEGLKEALGLTWEEDAN